jgi:hypothetical protein
MAQIFFSFHYLCCPCLSASSAVNCGWNHKGPQIAPYGGRQWHEDLKKQGIPVYTPVKHEKGQEHPDGTGTFFSQLVSKARQTREPFFNRLNEKTIFSRPRKRGEADGFIAFIFARFAVAALYP